MLIPVASKTVGLVPGVSLDLDPVFGESVNHNHLFSIHVIIILVKIRTLGNTSHKH